MDDPELDANRHRLALEALARINAVSLGAWRLGRTIADLHRRRGEPVHVLDVACGGGDVLVRVAVSARRAGRPVVLHGCDLSPRALDEARRAGNDVGVADGSSGSGAATLRFFRLDALRDPIPDGYHLVTSSLFLHHLDWSDTVALLGRMAAASRHRLFVQDLRRTRLGWGLAWLGLHTLTRSEVARVDGLRSVEGAYTVSEARRLCTEAGLHGADVATGWPQRFVIRWDREAV